MKQKLTTLFAMSLVIFSCTKKLDYKEQYKEDVMNRADVDTSAEYIYVPSMASASRTSKVARPFWMGQEKIVKLQFTNNSLQVLETESDARFTGNSTNMKLVMEIPVTHLEYHCAKDRYGECKNEEEEDKDIPWAQKSKFKPDFSNVKFAETNILPIQVENLFGGSCYTEVSARPVNFEFTRDTLNFKIERTFKASPQCLDMASLDSFSDLTTTAVYHYSIAKLGSLTDKQYKSVDYPFEDQFTFGFFKTTNKPLDVDNNQTSRSEKTLLNRWSPNRSEVVYYLSDEFAKSENKDIRQSTYEVFDKMNRSLVAAGAKFKLVLKDGQGKEPGDIRNNMIVMVEDPVASSVIGYGPSLANPNTGELLSARVVMYLGTIHKYIKYAYNEVRRRHIEIKVDALKSRTQAAAAAKAATLPKSKLALTTVQTPKKLLELTGFSTTFNKSPSRDLVSKFSNLAGPSALVDSSLKSYSKDFANSKVTADVFLAQHNACALSGEMPPINTVIDGNLTKRFGQKMKSWEDLTEREKEEAINIITPEIWAVTLIHELGHNLGLRHNFAGSEDKDNFYSDVELNQMGIKHKVHYSSVMDYGASELSVLPVLGKYDIAALRYGYTGQIETDKGLIQVKTTIEHLDKKLNLKNFKFCTDEQIDTNANCKQFDDGSSLVEIAQSLIKRYKDYYSYRNQRNQALNFSLGGDRNYAGTIDNLFKSLRIFLEVYERVSAQDVSEQKWQTEATYKDVRDAAILTANFFMGVLKTPDTLCALAETKTPTKIYSIVPLQDYETDDLSCFDVELKAGYTMVGQAGKSFLSRKGPQAGNPYVDQIDVRGIWIDKVLAVKYLFARTFGDVGDDDNYSFNKIKMNYLDIPALEGPILETMTNILLNVTSSNLTFETAQGEPYTLTTTYDLFKSQVIPKHYDARVMKLLRLENRDQYLQEVILAAVDPKEATDVSMKDADQNIKQAFGIYKSRQIFGLASAPKGTSMTTVDQDLYAATPNNKVGRLLVTLLGWSRTIKSITSEQREMIVKLQADGKPLPTKATVSEKAVMALGKDVMKAAETGELKGPAYYEKMLSLLPAM